MKITKRRRKRYGGSLGGDIFIFVVLVLLGLFMIFPIYLSVIQSLKAVPLPAQTVCTEHHGSELC